MRKIYYRRFLCLGITMITAVMNSVGNLTQTGQDGRCIFQLLYNFDRAFLINPASVCLINNAIHRRSYDFSTGFMQNGTHFPALKRVNYS